MVLADPFCRLGSCIGSRIILLGGFDVILKGFSLKADARGGGDIGVCVGSGCCKEPSVGVVEISLEFGLAEASSERWPESLSWLLCREGKSFLMTDGASALSKLDIRLSIVPVDSLFVMILSVPLLVPTEMSSSSSSFNISFP